MGLKPFGIVRVHRGLGQVVTGDVLEPARRRIAQHEQLSSYAPPAKLDGFVDLRDREGADAFLGQASGYLDAAMPVCVRFYDRHDLRPPGHGAP